MGTKIVNYNLMKISGTGKASTTISWEISDQLDKTKVASCSSKEWWLI